MLQPLQKNERVANILWALIELKPLTFLLIKGGGENNDRPAPVKYPIFTTLPIVLWVLLKLSSCHYTTFPPIIPWAIIDANVK